VHTTLDLARHNNLDGPAHSARLCLALDAVEEARVWELKGRGRGAELIVGLGLGLDLDKLRQVALQGKKAGKKRNW
jgi:hypothetical protein